MLEQVAGCKTLEELGEHMEQVGAEEWDFDDCGENSDVLHDLQTYCFLHDLLVVQSTVGQHIAVLVDFGEFLVHNMQAHP